jgi:hypothetical protein
MQNNTIFIASPGTGKTTRLISIVQKLLDGGTAPEEIGYTTFTKAGAAEARIRATEKTGLPEEKLLYFHTLHKLAYNNTPFRTMLSRDDYRTLGRQLKMPMSGSSAGGDFSSPLGFDCKGDTLLNLYNLMRVRCENPEQFRPFLRCYPWATDELFTFFVKSVEAFKEETCRIDFTDQLQGFIDQGRSLPLRHLFVDEAQDLSRLQWRMVELMSGLAERVYVAGDDKQSIYVWGGADPEGLLNLKGTREVLDQSYRIPKTVHILSEVIAKRIKKKQKYHYKPREAQGEVQRISSINSIDMSKGTWLLLARNKRFLEEFDDHCFKKGYLFETRSDNDSNPKAVAAAVLWDQLLKGFSLPAADAKLIYSFMKSRERVKHGYKKVLDNLHDKEMITLEMLRSDFGLLTVGPWQEALNRIGDGLQSYIEKVIEIEGLTTVPRITINTIHGTKGQEADNVVISSDMGRMAYQEMQSGSDDEHRVFYVGVTRAKEKLYIMRPKTEMSYPI